MRPTDDMTSYKWKLRNNSEIFYILPPSTTERLYTPGENRDEKIDINNSSYLS
jgi:hypothetical protein